jgi:hypothetical protein
MGAFAGVEWGVPMSECGIAVAIVVEWLPHFAVPVPTIIAVKVITKRIERIM